MGSADEAYNNPFVGIYEPFEGIMEMDFELHGIFMDHEPEQEFFTSLDKCKDVFLNVLLSDANLRNASMSDEVRVQVYHANESKSDEEVEEEVKNNYRILDPNVRWDLMEPKGTRFTLKKVTAKELLQQLKHSLDEVEAAMDEILGCTPELEFTEGNPDDVLAEKILLTEDQVHDLLQSGYSMAEIESMEGFRVELDDTPHVEMDVQEVGEHPVLNDDEGDDCGVDAGMMKFQSI
ncbi:hypothetical protein LXL04_025213 [Taraxacum kok-saghyz]